MKKGVYIVVVHDTIVQSREYVVLANDQLEARTKVAEGKFLSESEATTMEHVGESVVISSEKVGTTDAG